jgi:hypothetical protein
MKDVLKQWLSAVRVWLGWGNLSGNRLTPPHGWLLPSPVTERAQKGPRPHPSGQPLPATLDVRK